MGKGAGKLGKKGKGNGKLGTLREKVQDVRVGAPAVGFLGRRKRDAAKGHKSCLLLANLDSSMSDAICRKKSEELANATVSAGTLPASVLNLRFLEHPRSGMSFGICVVEFSGADAVQRCLTVAHDAAKAAKDLEQIVKEEEAEEKKKEAEALAKGGPVGAEEDWEGAEVIDREKAKAKRETERRAGAITTLFGTAVVLQTVDAGEFGLMTDGGKFCLRTILDHSSRTWSWDLGSFDRRFSGHLIANPGSFGDLFCASANPLVQDCTCYTLILLLHPHSQVRTAFRGWKAVVSPWRSAARLRSACSPARSPSEFKSASSLQCKFILCMRGNVPVL